MNAVALMGRLTKDPDVRYSQGQDALCIARYTLAVDSRRKGPDGNYVADYISCVAMGRNGEFAEKYFAKGQRVAVTGRWQTGSYTNKDGVKVYTNDCYVNTQEFADAKKENAAAAQTEPTAAAQPVQAELDEFMNIPEGIEDDLPFT